MQSEPRTISRILAIALAYASLGSTNAQTASDGCGTNVANQYAVGTACAYVDFDKPASFGADHDPGTCNAGSRDDAFGWFTATSNTTFITYDPDNAHRPILHVFTGTCGALIQVGCVDAGSDGANAQLMIQTVPGTNYQIRIQRYNTNNAMTGRICIWSPTTTNWCGYPAISQIPVGTTCTPQPFVKLDAYTATMNPTGCGAGNYDDAFGWFTATETTTLIHYDPDGNQRAILHVFTGTCGSLTQVGCVDAGANGNNATITLSTVVGTNYLIRVQLRNANTEMNGTICVSRPLVNNECSGATELFVAPSCFMEYFTNISATGSSTTPAPACGGSTASDVWFKFVAPASGAVRIFSEAGTLSDGVFQVYSGTCGALSLVTGGCDNDGGTGVNDLMPYLDRRCTPLTGGQTYYIRFWGQAGATGTFGLCVYGPDAFPTPVQDCGGGLTVCGSGAINNSSDWTGCSADLDNTNRGCLSDNERQGTWYYFSPRSPGNITFTIQPTNNMGQPVNVDYDFAIWGPTNAVSCPPTGTPLRCSYANPLWAGTYQTGLRTGEGDVSENASIWSNGFVAPINVSLADVGKVYTIYIDNFSANGQSFNLSWGLAAPNQLDCSVLPISIIDLKATVQPRSILLNWVAQDAAATDHFIVERSVDGRSFEPIGNGPAVLSGGGTTDHTFLDTAPAEGMNFYRIVAVGADGAVTYTNVVSALYHPQERTLVAIPNPAHSTVQFHLAALPLNESIEIRVMDASGRVVSEERHLSITADTMISLSVDHLTKGYYMVKMMNGHGAQLGSGRFVKE